MLPPLFASVDLLSQKIIDRCQIESMVEAAHQHARAAELRGDVSTSLELPETRLSYRLLDGEQVHHHLPDLERLYREDIFELAERMSGLSLRSSPDERNGVNINVLEGQASRYEWHVDSNPITGLLALTDSDGRSGGRLLFGSEPSTQVQLSLRAGQLLLFDAREAAHAVEPLLDNLTRVTAPMNFFVEGESVVRPEGLDDSLYGPTASG